MKKFLRIGWVITCIIVLAFYTISCLTVVISPSAFSFISLFALVFPFIFLAAFLCALSLLLIHKKTALLVIAAIFMLGFKNLANTVAINSGKWDMEKAPNSLRILTWNVEQFVSLAPQNKPQAQTRVHMLNAISQYNPDILCFQEYLDVFGDGYSYMSVKKELDSLGYRYSYVSNDTVITTWAPIIVFQGCAIYSKTPLVDSSRVNLAHILSKENLIYTDIKFNNRPLRIITGHLSSFRLYADTLKTGTHKSIYELTFERKHSIEYKIRETEIEHKREVGIIRDVIAKSPHPVVYCGDINSTPATYTYNTLRGDLQDAFLQKGAGLGGTFYKLPSTIRIDVCLPDKSLQVLQCTVPQLYLSDHFPVVTDVTWK